MDIIEGLGRPWSVMDYGPPKVGKTTMAGTMMESVHLNPERILYLDNHGSSASLIPTPHQYTKAEPWGVFKSSDPDVILEKLLAAPGKYEGVILDDLSEQTLADMDSRNTKSGGTDKSRMRNWGNHLDAYSHALRKLYPEDSGMYVLVIARSGWSANPLKKPDPEKPMDREGLLYQPLFKGQLGSWIPYSHDIVAYHSMDIVGSEVASKMHFWPEGDIVVANRWLKQWKDKKIPKTLSNPTFDKVYDLITQVYA